MLGQGASCSQGREEGLKHEREPSAPCLAYFLVPWLDEERCARDDHDQCRNNGSEQRLSRMGREWDVSQIKILSMLA